MSLYIVCIRRRGSTAQKRRIKRSRHFRLPPSVALSPNKRWGMGFVKDELTQGRRFRVLTRSITGIVFPSCYGWTFACAAHV